MCLPQKKRKYGKKYVNKLSLITLHYIIVIKHYNDPCKYIQFLFVYYTLIMQEREN